MSFSCDGGEDLSWLQEVEDVRLLLEEEFLLESKCDIASYRHEDRGVPPSAKPGAPKGAAKRVERRASDDGAGAASSAPPSARPSLPAKNASLPSKLSSSSSDQRVNLLVGPGEFMTGLRQESSRRRSVAGRTA